MASKTESIGGLLDTERLARAKSNLKEYRVAYMFVGPTLLYLVFLVWYPWLQGVVISFYSWPIFGPKEFIGLDNYRHLLTWDAFWISFRATLIYGTQTIGHLVFGTTMALLVWKIRNKTLVGIFSVIFLIPYVVPPLVSGTIFRFVLHPDVGTIQKLALNAGILSEPIYWMSNGELAIIVVTLIGVWTWTPLVFILVFASLESIPKSYYELADIYGANVWERFRYITFPQIKTVLLIVLIIRIIYNLGKVSQPLVILRGGPGYATSIFGILLYRIAWLRGELGLAFAVGIVLGIIALLFVMAFVYKFEKEQGEVQAI